MRNDKKTLDQTDAEYRADFFGVHLLRGRGLREEIVGSNDCAGGLTVPMALATRYGGGVGGMPSSVVDGEAKKNA